MTSGAQRELFLIRHAEAVDVAASDEQRGLTERGRASFAATVRGLAKLDIHFDRILHSPFLRARQTAELCSELSGGGLEPCDELGDAPSRRLLERIREETGRTALVGHEPWMSELCARLTTGDKSHSAGLRFRKGTVAWLRGQPDWGAMSLAGFLPPELTRSLGDAE